MSHARALFADWSKRALFNDEYAACWMCSKDDVWQTVSLHMMEYEPQRLGLEKSNHSKMRVFNDRGERLNASGEAISGGSIYLSEVHN